MKTITISFALLCALLVAGCGSRQIRVDSDWRLPEPMGKEDALIVGHIVYGDGEDRLVPSVVRVFGKGKIYAGIGLQSSGEDHDVFTDGRFVARVKPGTYHLNSFYAGGTMFHIETDAKTVKWFTVKPGEVYYVGTFHAKLTQPEKLWAPGQFKIERAKSPTRRELMQWLVKVSQGTGWEARVRRQARSG